MSSPASSAHRVLVIDDDRKLGRLIREYLEPMGYAVTLAVTGPEGLETARTEKFDAILLDVMLPGLDGFEVLKELRKTTPGLKFIFISGHTDDAFKRTLDENEAYAFLPKPFTLPQLAAKVKEQLSE